MSPTEHVTRALRINGEERTVAFPVHHTLLEVLREECGLTGTKHGCELGECGTCTVLLDGRPVLSCLVLAAETAGRSIETVEGLQRGNALHPLQAAFADLGAAQCGYCTPGILMTAKALLAERPSPTDEDGAGAALAELAAVLGAGQTALLAQHLEEGMVGREDHSVVLAVHPQAERDGLRVHGSAGRAREVPDPVPPPAPPLYPRPRSGGQRRCGSRLRRRSSRRWRGR